MTTERLTEERVKQTLQEAADSYRFGERKCKELLERLEADGETEGLEDTKRAIATYGAKAAAYEQALSTIDEQSQRIERLEEALNTTKTHHGRCNYCDPLVETVLSTKEAQG